MSVARFIVVTALLGCASAGVFPNAGDPGPVIGAAQRQIEVAQSAGADSLAPQALATARRHLVEAQVQVQANRNGRAAVAAQQAAASAVYAKAQADRVLAVRDSAHAEQALRAVPPGRGGL